jgi:diketogulonate reductase-like aldo/keto reductase
MKAAWDLGVNTIDTANIYSNGESERIVAKFIKKVCALRMPFINNILMYDHHSTIFLAPKS